LAWLEGPLGQTILEAETALAEGWLAEHPVFSQALCVAPQAASPVLGAVTARSTWCYQLVPAVEEGLGGSPGATPRSPRLVWGMPEALPFPSGELDLVVLLHPLEFSRAPYQILAEVERILAPNGRLMAFVFNPVSLFGLRRAFTPRARRRGPWRGRFWPGFMLRRMVESAGLAHERSRYLFFRPPLERPRGLRGTRFLERLPRRPWFPFGGVVGLQARKEEPGLTLLGPAFREELARGGKGRVPAYFYEGIGDRSRETPGPPDP